MQSHAISAMRHVHGAADGRNVVCQGVSAAAISMFSHIMPLHAPLSRPFNTRVWEDCHGYSDVVNAHWFGSIVLPTCN